MKGLDADRQQVIFSNMSERAAVRLREELENSGPTRLRDVETAQQAIVGIARGLQEKGELQIGSGSGAGNEEEESFV
jgi:flagellar motor switch protein FliG